MLFDDYNYKLINENIFRLKPIDYASESESSSFVSHRSFLSFPEADGISNLEGTGELDEN